MIHILSPINLYGETYDSFKVTLFDRDGDEVFESYYDSMHQDNCKIQDKKSVERDIGGLLDTK